jgi:TolB-like protein/Tfp pilus assembly protein PilF
MTIWAAEKKELEKLYYSNKEQLPGIMKELEQLIKTEDANVVLLYSRRCLEVIITDLCESELNRSRKTEPLKGIIDKLNSEEKVPSNIISSMLSLNSMSIFGTHPKDFDQEQVKPVLNNLAVIIRWYIRFKDLKIISKDQSEEDKIESKDQHDSARGFRKQKTRIILFFTGLILVVFVISVIVFNNIGDRGKNNLNNQNELEKTIAIMPFRNLSNDSTQAYFCDGIMEEILNNLQRVNEFTVRSRTSTEQYRTTTKIPETIGKELNVNYLIEGSVGKEDNNLKIWVNLINVKTNKSIWSNDYTREMKQIFSLQSEIAKEIAAGLKTILSPEELIQIDKKLTNNLEAYNYYLHGNEYRRRSFEKQDFEIAIKMYTKAVELDPNFAQAYVKISLCYIQLNWFHYDRSMDWLAKSKEAIDAAFKIDPNLPDAHLALGNYYYMGFLNYTEALKQVSIAEEKLVNNPECIYLKANIYRRAGEWSLAMENYLKASELDPGLPATVVNVAITYSLLGEYQEAEKYFKKALLLNPTFMEAIWQESFMYMKWEGNTIKARATIKEAFQFNESISEPMLFESYILMEIYDGNYQKALTYLSSKDVDLIEIQFYINLKSLLYARVYNLMNMPEKAHEYFDSARVTLESMVLKNPDDPRLYSATGIAYAGLGLKEKAIEAGKKAVELMPIDKEAYRGVFRVEDLARIYVMVGEYDLAIEQIRVLLKIPSRLSVKLLLLDPAWKPLWELPEFRKMIKESSS